MAADGWKLNLYHGDTPELFDLNSDPGEQRIRQEGDNDAKDDVKLEHAGEASAMGGRRDLGDVEGRGDRGDADADAAKKPRQDE